jgi:hypothetical protein
MVVGDKERLAAESGGLSTAEVCSISAAKSLFPSLPSDLVCAQLVGVSGLSRLEHLLRLNFQMASDFVCLRGNQCTKRRYLAITNFGTICHWFSAITLSFLETHYCSGKSTLDQFE